MRTVINKKCEQCNVAFDAPASEVKRGNARFCSRRCFGDHRSAIAPVKKPNVECANCRAPFYKKKSSQKLSKSGLFFCNRKCKDDAQRIGGIKEIMPPHFGTSTSYRTICFRHHKKECVVCGENKIVAVHHYDENHSNNDPANLIPLCPTHHQYVHSRYKELVMEKIDKWRKGYLHHQRTELISPEVLELANKIVKNQEDKENNIRPIP
jgi:hypothetical protein